MAPAIANNLLSGSDVASLGPLAARSVLLARDSSSQPTHDPANGTLRPQDINNPAVFAVFGLLGVAFVVTGIWFFFWAKNGGFYFKKTDWEDYKSTVLRRKIGPNGTIYSDVTASTVLGGGSVYKDVDDGTTTTGDDLTTVVSATTGITGITGGVSDFSGREKRRRKREQKDREKERRREEKRSEKEERKKKKSGRKVDGEGVIVDEDAEADAQQHLRDYRHEKAARVGGINREGDGSTWDGSTNPSWSTASPSHAAESTADSGSTVTSELLQNRERTPTSTPTKKDAGERAGRIRKVYSTADKNAARENERIRAEARRLQEKGRAAAASANVRRDFSFTRGADETMALRRIDEAPAGTESVVSGSSYATESTNDRAEREKRARSRSRPRAAPQSEASSRVPGSWVESEVGSASDAGTKVYTHSHHIPTGGGSSVTGTSVSDFAYAEEKRKKRGGAGARRTRE